jgi:hypothetical protein
MNSNSKRGLIKGLVAVCLVITLGLSACSNVNKQASYPTREAGSDKIIYSDGPKQETIWGDGQTLGDKIFGREKDKDAGAGLGVNSFLWRASLDTISFMPVASADPFGGVILTDWYENPDTPGQRFKLSVYILDRQLRADGVRVSVFKQTQERGGWHDAKVPPDMGTNIENAILTRARELRVAQLAK